MTPDDTRDARALADRFRSFTDIREPELLRAGAYLIEVLEEVDRVTAERARDQRQAWLAAAEAFAGGPFMADRGRFEAMAREAYPMEQGK